MSQNSIRRRLDRIQAKVSKTTLIDDLIRVRVAGKTQKQADADVLKACRLLIDMAELPPDELEAYQLKFAEFELSCL
ncbi:MAG: hypothetical protein NT013_00435 [Planctomycetia bacterium]|nr:hypothetical protein [Planctomycetia bacterium]